MNSVTGTVSSREPVLRSLMLRGLDGDQRAYAELLASLAQLLARYFEARLRSSPDAVEDLVQETLLALHEKRHTYDRTRLLTPWVFAIARHKLLNGLRGRARAAALPLDAAEDAVDPANPEQGAVHLDVARMLEWLSPRQRRLVEDLKIEGRSVAETARRQGMTDGAVKVALHRALRSLAEKVRHED